MGEWTYREVLSQIIEAWLFGVRNRVKVDRPLEREDLLADLGVLVHRLSNDQLDQAGLNESGILRLLQ